MLDDDPDRFGTLDFIKTYNFENCSFIIFVRSTLFQLGEKRYEDNLPENFAEFDINRLNDGEVASFCKLFTDLGLWGDYSGKNHEEKQNLLKVEFERSIQKLILSVFESSDIGRKLIVEGKNIIASGDSVAQIVIMTFILNRLEHVPSPTMMSELLPNIDVWKVARSSEFRAAGEFIRFEDGVVRSRSSILANVILRSAVKADLLVETTENIVRHLGRKTRNSSLHHVFTQLMRFPTLEGMIDHPRKREIIIGYFQSIKDLAFCQSNADFWLHYAMARLTYGEFDIASKYFTTAKHLARGNSKKLTDVNNHYARLLLDSRIKTDDYDDYFKAFDMAHSILIEQMNRDDNRHYPYRQAKKYVEFISYRRSKLSPDELRRFAVSCRQVKVAISNLSSRLSVSGEIAECDRQMDRAIEIATTSL